MSASSTGPSKALLTTIVGFVVLVILAFSVFGYINTVRNEGIKQENALEAQYRANQNELSTYVLQFKESLGVAGAGADKLEEILTEAIKGRYDGNMAPGTGGSMFSAITEAYPDLTATTQAYAKVQDLVVSGRNGYKNEQNKLLDQIRAYENWSESGLFRSMVVDMIGFPSDSLEARIGNTTYKGAEALDRMKDIVLVKDATEAYDTGEMAPLIEPEKAAK